MAISTYVEEPLTKGKSDFRVNPQPKERSMLLHDANNIINKDRASTHGEAEDSFQGIANMWNAYLATKGFIKQADLLLQAVDVAQMMVCFKIARAAGNPGHRDNWVDQVGYSALAGEIGLANSKKDNG